MTYTKSSNLAILACPGGEAFANSAINQLENLYKRQLNEQNNTTEKNDEVQHSIPKFKVDARFTYFMNGEFKTEILETIRGKDVYIFQDVENKHRLSFNENENSKTLSVNDHLMSLIVSIDAVRHAGAGRISLVLPVYPYSRQHKKKGREGLTASLLGHIYEDLGVEQIITLDIHSREIENAFHAACLQNLHASYQIISTLADLVDLRKDSKDPFVVVSPDSGAVDRNKFYSLGLQKPLAMIYKERDYAVVTQNAKQSNITNIYLLGNVEGKNVFLADDMLGTGSTLLKAMEFLKSKGAKKVIAAVSLPFFTGTAIKNFDEAYNKNLFDYIIGTNAVYHTKLKEKPWYKEVDVSKLFAEVIMRLHNNQSISDLLDNRDIIKKLLSKDKK